MNDNDQEDIVEQFNRKQAATQKSDTNFIFAIVWLISIYFFVTFFTRAIPDGEYLTNQVKVKDQLEDETLYLNLLVVISNEDYDETFYYVRGIVSPKTGKVIETDSDNAFFGKKCEFWEEHDFDHEYTVTLNYDDVQVTVFGRIKRNPLGFILRTLALAFFTALFISQIKESKAKKNPGN